LTLVYLQRSRWQAYLKQQLKTYLYLTN